MKIKESQLRTIVREETEALLEEQVSEISKGIKGRMAGLGLGLAAAGGVGAAGAGMAAYVKKADVIVIDIGGELQKYQGPAIRRAYEELSGKPWPGAGGKELAIAGTAALMYDMDMRTPEKVRQFMEKITSR